MHNSPSHRPNEAPLPDPLGYFLTWTTYGTWLPGDDRGWTKFNKGFQTPNPMTELEAMARMTEDACRLTPEEREVVHKTVSDHCTRRRWELFAVNCRTNHVHVVVAANRKPKIVREQLKAWCTRRLKECRQNARENWWTERGSIRILSDEASLHAAVAYVTDGQEYRGSRH